MLENYRKVNTQEVSDYEYCIITMPFNSHMKAACIDILIFTLHGVILGVSYAGPGVGLGAPDGSLQAL